MNIEDKIDTLISVPLSKYKEVLAENERLRAVLADMANNINVVGSAYDRAMQSIDELMLSVKRQARAALKEDRT
jgi:hypothetical protein